MALRHRFGVIRFSRDGFGVEMWGIEPHAAAGVEPSAAYVN